MEFWLKDFSNIRANRIYLVDYSNRCLKIKKKIEGIQLFEPLLTKIFSAKNIWLKLITCSMNFSIQEN